MSQTIPGGANRRQQISGKAPTQRQTSNWPSHLAHWTLCVSVSIVIIAPEKVIVVFLYTWQPNKHWSYLLRGLLFASKNGRGAGRPEKLSM